MKSNQWLLRSWIVLAISLGCGLVQPQTSRADFALRDGDTVVFLGDSITAARTYGKIVENYALLRFPSRTIHFVNAGRGGDTAEGGLKRLDRDVFDRGATVLIVAYGINDIGWGTKADADHKRAYLNAIRGIVEQCKTRGVRAYIGSAAITAENPVIAERGFLQEMCDEGMALARSLGEHSIDIQRTMRSIQRKVLAYNATSKADDKSTLHAADGVHLSDLGQLAMAVAILKGLGAPSEVSAVALDAKGPKIISATGCSVNGLAGRIDDRAGQLEFQRLDDGLPINFGLFGALQFRFVPIPEELNQYLLTVANLPSGRFEVLVDGRLLGKWTHEQLAKGLNVASATANGWEPGGPWDAQATMLIAMTDSRDQNAEAGRLLDEYLPQHPARIELHNQGKEINRSIEAHQRALVKPRSFHFVVRHASAE
jgi:lysophospholipase L1-like esterase